MTPGKSDPVHSTRRTGEPATEGEERKCNGKGPTTSRILHRKHARTRGGQSMPTSLKEIAKQAKQDPKRRFTNLHPHLNRSYSLTVFGGSINGQPRSGWDKRRPLRRKTGGERADLLRQVKHGMYRARLVRRRYIQRLMGN